MATPEATFVIFLFYFHLFTMNVTQALPLEAIKGEAGATSREGNNAKARTHRSNQLELTATKKSHIHEPPLTRDLGSAPSLESL
jgi:hypothetical protein